MLKDNEISVDCYAGGGGASVGIEWAIGRPVDHAINHDPAAIAMHELNHPKTTHHCESVWNVDPVKLCAGRTVGLAWFSPDCTHFTIASGGKPLNKKIRALAWLTVHWCLSVDVVLFHLENVKEFQTWGPLIDTGDGKLRPDPDRKGETFEGFILALTSGLKPSHPAWNEAIKELNIQYDVSAKLKLIKGLGYDLEHRIITASSNGAATTRPRFFITARKDGNPINWPKPIPIEKQKPISDCIDWSVEGRSIFNRKKPLAPKTLNRIWVGLDKYVFNCEHPFIAPVEFTKEDNSQLAAAFVMKMRNGCVGHSMNEPMHTVTGGGNHFCVVFAFLVKYFGTSNAKPVTEPAGTFTTKDRYALVTVHSDTYQIRDIKLRVFMPKELFLAMGFPSDYKHAHDLNGKKIPLAEQLKRVGNAVSPPTAAAIISANMNTEIQKEAAG